MKKKSDKPLSKKTERPSPCLTDDEVIAYVASEIAAPEKIEDHLLWCSRCLERVMLEEGRVKG